MNNEIEMPEPPEGYKWVRVGWNKENDPHHIVDSELVVTYKPVLIKPKTKLSDLIGEDGQKNAYIVQDNGVVYPFQLYMPPSGKWKDEEKSRDELSQQRWSHSPFTKYEDANEFRF